jgi:hypothetical protein
MTRKENVERSEVEKGEKGQLDKERGRQRSRRTADVARAVST